MMRQVAQLRVDVPAARIFEHGWQSWTPSTAYPLDEQPRRPVADRMRIMAYRPDRVVTADCFWGDGLLAVYTGQSTHVFAAPPHADPIAGIRATANGDIVTVAADAPVEHTSIELPLDPALARWAEGYAQAVAVPTLRPAPTVWCSWYHYFTDVTEDDIDENLDAMDQLGLNVQVVQIDDGWQADIGDWLTTSARFRSLAGTVQRIRDRGRRAGIWVAPFLVGERSALARDHPDWLVQGVSAGTHWQQELGALDITVSAAEAHLRRVFEWLRDLGIDYFKIDFIYAGALAGGRADRSASGLTAYTQGLRVIRDAIGPEAYLVGCGAPILPSVGLVDAMRVSPDTDPVYHPRDGDLSQPAQESAVLTGRARAWQHGRFWVNDPDCLIARPAVERREDWAEHIAKYGGLRASSDRLFDLDEWGLETTRRLLVPLSATPFQSQT